MVKPGGDGPKVMQSLQALQYAHLCILEILASFV